MILFSFRASSLSQPYCIIVTIPLWVPLMLCGHSKLELAILLSSQVKSQFRTAAERRAHAHIDTRAVFQMVPAVLGEQALWVLIHAKHGQEEKKLCFYLKDQNI